MPENKNLSQTIMRICELIGSRNDSQIDQDRMVAYWLMMGYDIGKASKKNTT